MKHKIIQKLFSKKGFFDRDLVVSVSENGIGRYFYKKIFKKMMRLANPLQRKFKRKPEINVLEKIGYAFEPINFLSKIKHKFKK